MPRPDCERPGDCAYPGCDCPEDDDPFEEDDDPFEENALAAVHYLD